MTALGISRSSSVAVVLGCARDCWRSLSTALFDRYRPELHYMRGPGPKWREKHATVGAHR